MVGKGAGPPDGQSLWHLEDLPASLFPTPGPGQVQAGGRPPRAEEPTSMQPVLMFLWDNFPAVSGDLGEGD